MRKSFGSKFSSIINFDAPRALEQTLLTIWRKPVVTSGCSAWIEAKNKS